MNCWPMKWGFRHTRIPRRAPYRLLVRRADKAAAVGNLVRAAILRTRAARHVEAKTARRTRADAWADLDRLAVRLLHAAWVQAVGNGRLARSLISLLDQSSRGLDSQATCCTTCKRSASTTSAACTRLDVWRWMISFGRTPLKRMLPGQRDVLVTKHLRGAVARLPAVRVAGHARKRLSSDPAIGGRSGRGAIAFRFQPLIESALDQVGLIPQNLPKAVARMKLIEELLDRVIERVPFNGRLRVLSFNNLKLPDFTSFKQLIVGGQLHPARPAVGSQSRWRLSQGRNLPALGRSGSSSLAFGTPVGRFLTRYVVLPFGGSFVAARRLAAFDSHDFGLVRIRALAFELLACRCGGWACFFSPDLSRWLSSDVCGEPAWRRTRTEACSLIFQPGLASCRPCKPFLRVYYRLVVRYLIKPLVVSAVAAAALDLCLQSPNDAGKQSRHFLAVNLLLNSRIGRSVDEMVTDWLVNVWHKFRIHVVTAVLRLIVDVFNHIIKRSSGCCTRSMSCCAFAPANAGRPLVRSCLE